MQIDGKRLAVNRKCNCAAGAGGVCKHIGATITAINGHLSSSKTDLPQVWGKPSTVKELREEYTHGKRIEDLYLLPKKYRIDIPPAVVTSNMLIGIPCALRMMLQEEERSASEQVAMNILQEVFLMSVLSSEKRAREDALWQIVDRQFESITIGTTWDKLQDMSSEESQFFDTSVRLTPQAVVNLSASTCDQSQCATWVKARECRVSASSKAHRIKIRRKYMSSLLDSFMSNKGFKGNAATRYGNKMEDHALQEYLKIAMSDNAFMKVIKCGVVVRESQPWLCASPDGILLDNNKTIKLIEVKCPHSCAGKSIINEDGSCNVRYLVTDTSGQVLLRESDVYYTQIQMQLYVTGLTECDLVIYSSDQTVVVNIKINQLFLSQIVPKIEDFYFKFYLPKLASKSV